MKRCLLLFFLIARCAVAGDTIVLCTAHNGTNAAVTLYEVERERLAAQPTWDPVSGDPPLSVSAAVARARAWIGTQPYGSSSQTVHNISMTRHMASTYTTWVYSINFDLGLIGVGKPEWYLKPRQAYVLLDGSIVEPVQHPEGDTRALDRSAFSMANRETPAESHPVQLADLYLRIDHLDEFKRVLSTASRAHLAAAAGGETNLFATMKRKALAGTNSLLGATYRIGGTEDLRKDMAGVDPKVATLKLRTDVSLVYWRFSKEVGGKEEGPVFVIKEDGYWRLLLPGLAPENYYDLPKGGAK